MADVLAGGVLVGSPSNVAPGGGGPDGEVPSTLEGEMAFDAKTVSTNDWGVMGAAAGVFLSSLIGSYISVSVEVPEEFEAFATETDGGVTNAWWSWATLGLLLLLAVGALAAARVFGQVKLPEIGVGWNLIAAAAAGLGALLVILRAVTAGDSGGVPGFEASVGPGWSGYVLMILAVVETVFAVMAFRTSGEQVPWQQTGSSKPPAAATDRPTPAAPTGPPPPPRPAHPRRPRPAHLRRRPARRRPARHPRRPPPDPADLSAAPRRRLVCVREIGWRVRPAGRRAPSVPAGGASAARTAARCAAWS